MYKSILKKEISEKNAQEILKVIRNILVFILILIWVIVPIIKEIKSSVLLFEFNQYVFIKRMGLIGLYFLLFDIYINLIKKDGKVEYLKQNLPIFVLMLYMIWTLISCFFSPHKEEAVMGTVYRKEGWITYLAYAGIFSCAFFLKSKKLKKFLLNTFIIVAILNIFLIELAEKKYFLKYLYTLNIRQGVFDQFNHYGYYLLLATLTANMLFIYEKNKFLKLIYLLEYGFLLYFLILNNTFGCYLSLFITLVIFFGYSIFQKKKRILSILSIIIFVIMSCIVQDNGKNIAKDNIEVFYKDIKNIITIVIPKAEEKIVEDSNKTVNNVTNKQVNNNQVKNYNIEQAGTGRIKLWKYGIKVFLERPILGYGPENLGFKYEELHINQDRPHNLIVQLLVTSGIPGMILYVLAIRNYCNKRNEIYKRRKTIAYS